jgi:hypothetical protein
VLRSSAQDGVDALRSLELLAEDVQRAAASGRRHIELACVTTMTKASLPIRATGAVSRRKSKLSLS